MFSLSISLYIFTYIYSHIYLYLYICIHTYPCKSNAFLVKKGSHNLKESCGRYIGGFGEREGEEECNYIIMPK